MKGLECSTCAFWCRPFPGAPLGECRRRAPALNGETQRGVWPLTGPDDGCGGHALRPQPVLHSAS